MGFFQKDSALVTAAWTPKMLIPNSSPFPFILWSTPCPAKRLFFCLYQPKSVSDPGSGRLLVTGNDNVPCTVLGTSLGLIPSNLYNNPAKSVLLSPLLPVRVHKGCVAWLGSHSFVSSRTGIQIKNCFSFSFICSNKLRTIFLEGKIFALCYPASERRLISNTFAHSIYSLQLHDEWSSSCLAKSLPSCLCSMHSAGLHSSHFLDGMLQASWSLPALS